jgi:predicted DNA-binding transcriptional regulator YafY
MARNEQLIRQHKVLQILERSRFGRTLNEVRDDLVDDLGLSSLHTRTLRRDLEALQASGVDVDSHESPRGRIWKLGPGFRGSHKITASATELIALSLGRDLLLPLAGTPFGIGVESFWSKMRETLPEAIWGHYEKYRRVLYVLGTPAKNYRKQEGMIKTVNRAIRQHREVEIEYQPLGKQPRRRQIRPYGVVVYQSSLYVVADACEVVDGDPIRHLKLDRFHRAEALDVYFKPREDFDLAEHLAQSLGIFSGGKPKKYRIRISAFAAPLIEEDPWHPDQQIESRQDGSIILSVNASHDQEIIPRVMALGANAEVLSPKSCREAVVEQIKKTAKLYK